MNYQNTLQTWDILPISEVIFAKRMSNDAPVKWSLYDVYKIASTYPLQISLFGRLMLEHCAEAVHSESGCTENRNTRLILNEKFLKKSTRDDLQGLTLSCGLVVSI